jgi:hypothetical protein
MGSHRRSNNGRRLGPSFLVLLAAVALSAPATAAAPVPFQIGKPKLNKKKGTASLAVKVSGKGKVFVSVAKNLSYTVIFFDGAGRGKLPIRPRQGKPVRQLKNTGKLKAKLAVTFTPQGPNTSGGPYNKVLRITLKRKR